MSAPEPFAQKQRENSKPKLVGRPWPKGRSGNPSGRRKGTLSPTAALKRVLTKADLKQIATKLIDLAKAGDRHALRILFDRIDGPLNASNLAIATASADGGPNRTKEENPLAGFDVQRLREIAAGRIWPANGDGEAAPDDYASVGVDTKPKADSEK